MNTIGCFSPEDDHVVAAPFVPHRHHQHVGFRKVDRLVLAVALAMRFRPHRIEVVAHDAVGVFRLGVGLGGDGRLPVLQRHDGACGLQGDLLAQVCLCRQQRQAGT